MSNIVTGDNVNVEALIGGDYIVIGCAVSCSFNYQNELIGKTDVNAGLFRKKRVRISDCSGTVEGVMTTASEATRLSIVRFLQEAVRRTENDLRFSYQDSNGNYIRIIGKFLVETIGLTAAVGDFCDFDMNLQGTGGIEITSIGNPALACPEMFSDWWETTPGASSISGAGEGGLNFAGHEVLEVDREGLQHDIITTGTPGNREAKYTGGATISFDPTNVFNPGERIFVLWTEDAS